MRAPLRALQRPGVPVLTSIRPSTDASRGARGVVRAKSPGAWEPLLRIGLLWPAVRLSSSGERRDCVDAVPRADHGRGPTFLGLRRPPCCCSWCFAVAATPAAVAVAVAVAAATALKAAAAPAPGSTQLLAAGGGAPGEALGLWLRAAGIAGPVAPTSTLATATTSPPSRAGEPSRETRPETSLSTPLGREGECCITAVGVRMRRAGVEATPLESTLKATGSALRAEALRAERRAS